MTTKPRRVSSILWNLGLVAGLALAAVQPMPAAADEIVKHFPDGARDTAYALHKTAVRAQDGTVEKTFFFDVGEDGSYFLSAWVMGVASKHQITVHLDGDTRPIGFLPMPETGWQASFLTWNDKWPMQIPLARGAHTLTFRLRGSIAPPVETLRIGRSQSEAALSDAAYRSYVAGLGTGPLSEAHYDKAKISEASLVGMHKLYEGATAPQSDYVYDLNLSFTYTYYGYFNLTAGQAVTFETQATATPVDTVMYLFHYSTPTLGSWSDDDGGVGSQSKITCTPTTTGLYMLMIRGFGGSSGTVDLYQNGALTVAGAVVGGKNPYSTGVSKTGELNYFTAKLTGDSRLWVIDSSSFPGLVKAQNDDYYSGAGDWSWGLASRVKATITPEVNYVIVGAYSSYNPTGTADVYQKCNNGDIMSWFENLKADDAIRSAPSSGVYNCISWSGYITDYWVWPPSFGSTWYDSNPLTSFDKFYGNNPQRYPGACTYTRSGATSSNAVVDLWALNGSYTHGSITKPGCGNPHGYDWESKPGGLARTFHPRNALNGNSYGQVVGYYHPAGVAAGECQTYAEAEAAGLVQRDVVTFSATESDKLGALAAALPADVTAEFDRLYALWKATWQLPEVVIHSDPRKYAESREYHDLLDFCGDHGEKIWPLVFVRFSQGDLMAVNAVEDLTAGQHGAFMEEVRQESRDPQNRYDAQGVYLAPSMEANVMRYLKRVLETL